MSGKFEDYLFEYPFDGSQWCFTIRATSQADAQARFRALGWAKFKGGPCETIPVTSPRSWFVPLTVWWRNRKRRYTLDGLLRGMTEENRHDEVELARLGLTKVDLERAEDRKRGKYD